MLLEISCSSGKYINTVKFNKFCSPSDYFRFPVLDKELRVDRLKAGALQQLHVGAEQYQLLSREGAFVSRVPMKELQI